MRAQEIGPFFFAYFPYKVSSMIEFEYLQKNDAFLAACDEVGRGPLAGPVVSCCVYLNGPLKNLENFLIFIRELGVNDSKKLTHKKRKEILEKLGVKKLIAKKSCVVETKYFSFNFYLQEISPAKIDKVNILNASLLSMKDAFEALDKDKREGCFLIDGNKIPKELENHVRAHAIVKGDARSALIGLASIIAKDYRDDLMTNLAKKYPGYGLEKHAGYPTKAHKEAIKNLGVSPIHRKTFRGVKEYVAQF